MTIFIASLVILIAGVATVGYLLLSSDRNGQFKSSRASCATAANDEGVTTGLNAPDKKEIAMQLLSSAENSSLDWRSQYGYIEYNVEGNTKENRGYTAGLVGFTSATGDMLSLLRYYQQLSPGNILQKYIPPLERAEGSAATTGLGAAFVRDWKLAAGASDGRFREAQDHERDRLYFKPAVALAQSDCLHELGQFAYYDAAVMHGAEGLNDIRATALKTAQPPSRGGEEVTYLNHFLDARRAAMLKEVGHSDTSRIDTMQRQFLRERNLRLTTPLSFSVYGDKYTVH